MVNKKGFIRTLEAVIAIILILGFIFWLTPKVVEVEEKVPEDVADSKEFILNQILLNKEYSECIAAVVTYGECKDGDVLKCDDSQKILDLFDYIPYGYNYMCEICSGSSQCVTLPKESEGKSIYTNTIFIHKTGADYNIMRIYIWKK